MHVRCTIRWEHPRVGNVHKNKTLSTGLSYGGQKV